MLRFPSLIVTSKTLKFGNFINESYLDEFPSLIVASKTGGENMDELRSEGKVSIPHSHF